MLLIYIFDELVDGLFAKMKGRGKSCQCQQMVKNAHAMYFYPESADELGGHSPCSCRLWLISSQCG